MIYKIEPIYFYFQGLLLCLSLLNKKIKFRGFIGGILFISFIGFSKIGADYLGYRDIYIAVSYAFEKVHGEYLFKKLMLGYKFFDLSYDIFRWTYLNFLLGLLVFFIKKLSRNVFYSLFLIYSLYIIYLCSAYRQLFSMTMCFGGFYLIKKRKIDYGILLNFISLFIHGSSIFPLAYFIYIKKRKIKIKQMEIFLSFVVAFILRITLGRYIGKVAMILNIGSLLPYLNDIVLISFGLLSRGTIGILIVMNYKKIRKNRFLLKIFYFYIIGIILYILIPFDLIAGRLFNNSRILEIILIPYIIMKQKSKSNKLIYFIIFTLISMAIFYNQLLKQGGYYPYTNILFEN